MVKNSLKNKPEKTVLVGVIKDRRDLGALLAQKWYRIPVKHAPKRKFRYLAFYQPAGFGRRGKRICYYARVLSQRTVHRKDLLPDELKHPRADDYYFLFRVDNIKKLPRPIKNVTPRRISFGFTTLNRLLKAKDILQLYNIAPTERIIGDALQKAGIRAVSQYRVSIGKKRYRLDFAILGKRGAVAIECDNRKAHAGRLRRKKDKEKDVALRRSGWTVIRLPERDIISNPKGCVARIKRVCGKLDG